MTQLDALDVSLGLLTLEQVADKLPQLPSEISPALLINRMIARGDLSTVQYGGKLWVKIEALRALMEGTPSISPTMVPLFWDKNPWIYYADKLEQAIHAELERQLPTNLDELLAKVKRGQPALLTLEYQRLITEFQRDGAQVDATISPELKAMLTAPVPIAEAVFQVPDASAFKNVGELFLASRLLHLGHLVAFNAPTVRKFSGRPNSTGFDGLYESPRAYTDMANTALLRMGDLRANRWVMVDDPTIKMSAPIKVTVVLNCSTIGDVAGTNASRLVMLTF